MALASASASSNIANPLVALLLTFLEAAKRVARVCPGSVPVTILRTQDRPVMITAALVVIIVALAVGCLAWVALT